MNQFISNSDKYFYDTFEYNGVTYIRESHNGSGIHWHEQKVGGGKNWETLSTIRTIEIEKQYMRAKKLSRVLKNDND